MAELPERPLTLLIAAIGGEGGAGVEPIATAGGRLLLDWIVAAARAEDYPVQSTLLPGTTQRTGQTTYYVEIYPTPWSALGNLEPVLRLSPRPGDVDIVVAYELVEAARQIQSGMVTPDRTTLIASTHRTYTMDEKLAQGDGRFTSGQALAAAQHRSRRAVMFDVSQPCQEHGCSAGSVLLGALAAADILPIAEATFASVVDPVGNRASDRAGYAAGLAAATAPAESPIPTGQPGKRRRAVPKAAAVLFERAERHYPEAVWPIIKEGVARLIVYQDRRYAALYLDRLDRVPASNDGASDRLTEESARLLALRMAYEDVVRVAQLKTGVSRYERLRREVGAADGDVVALTEYLKPGLPELCSVLPPWLARPLLAWARRHGLEHRFHLGLHVRSTSISGFALLRTLAALRGLRRHSYRYAVEQSAIERWLTAIVDAAATDRGLALEIVLLAGLIKGYSDTHRRGEAAYTSIFTKLVDDQTQTGSSQERTDALSRAREAALQDPDGQRLATCLADLQAQSAAAG